MGRLPCSVCGIPTTNNCRRCNVCNASYMAGWRDANPNKAKHHRDVSNARSRAKTQLSYRHREEFEELLAAEFRKIGIEP